jgi:hypothetical protein
MGESEVSRSEMIYNWVKLVCRIRDDPVSEVAPA